MGLLHFQSASFPALVNSLDFFLRLINIHKDLLFYENLKYQTVMTIQIFDSFQTCLFWNPTTPILLPHQSLSHCELITDEGIRHLGSSPCATEQLRVLELDNCPLVTDASLEHLMACQSLERIELYDCQLITRQGIRRLKVWISTVNNFWVKLYQV